MLREPAYPDAAARLGADCAGVGGCLLWGSLGGWDREFFGCRRMSVRRYVEVQRCERVVFLCDFLDDGGVRRRGSSAHLIAELPVALRGKELELLRELC